MLTKIRACASTLFLAAFLAGCASPYQNLPVRTGTVTETQQSLRKVFQPSAGGAAAGAAAGGVVGHQIDDHPHVRAVTFGDQVGELPHGEPGGDAVEWVAADGEWQRCALDAAAGVGFEDGQPVRRFRPRKGQRHLSGRWWCATNGGHVGFESWLERDHVMLLDFDPQMVGIATQPFWLHWSDSEGKPVSHAPDVFARRRDPGG